MEFDNESGIAKELQPNEGKKIVISHGSAVKGIAPLSSTPILVSLGSDGSLFVHKVPSGPVLAMIKYNCNASCMLCIPTKVIPLPLLKLFFNY